MAADPVEKSGLKITPLYWNGAKISMLVKCLLCKWLLSGCSSSKLCVLYITETSLFVAFDCAANDSFCWGRKPTVCFWMSHSLVSGRVGSLWFVCIGRCLEDSNLRCSYPCFNAMKGAKWEPCVGYSWGGHGKASIWEANWVWSVSTLSSCPSLWNQKQRRVSKEKEVGCWGRMMSKHRVYMRSKTAAAYVT